jgi:hypothetical protein
MMAHKWMKCEKQKKDADVGTCDVSPWVVYQTLFLPLYIQHVHFPFPSIVLVMVEGMCFICSFHITLLTMYLVDLCLGT